MGDKLDARTFSGAATRPIPRRQRQRAPCDRERAAARRRDLREEQDRRRLALQAEAAERTWSQNDRARRCVKGGKDSSRVGTSDTMRRLNDYRRDRCACPLAAFSPSRDGCVRRRRAEGRLPSPPAAPEPASRRRRDDGAPGRDGAPSRDGAPPRQRPSLEEELSPRAVASHAMPGRSPAEGGTEIELGPPALQSPAGTVASTPAVARAALDAPRRPV